MDFLHSFLDLTDSMSLRLGHSSKMVHNVTKGFHLQVLMPPGQNALELPEDIEVVRISTTSACTFVL